MTLLDFARAFSGHNVADVWDELEAVRPAGDGFPVIDQEGLVTGETVLPGQAGTGPLEGRKQYEFAELDAETADVFLCRVPTMLVVSPRVADWLRDLEIRKELKAAGNP